MALLRKKAAAEKKDAAGEGNENCSPAGCLSDNKNPGLPDVLLDFLSMVTKPLELSRITVKNDSVYYLPEHFKERAKKLRYLRTGLLLGELKKDRFEPSQALAMALKPEQFKQSVSWRGEDERVIRYLKGETIFLKEEEEDVKGWCLVCVDGFPLGFAKGTGTTLKNKYYPGWRWQ